MSTTLHPAAASISLSESTNGIPILRANARPTLVLPAPINPTITIGRSSKDVRFASMPNGIIIKKCSWDNKKLENKFYYVILKKY